jgi:malonyl-CoA O-methyltransferase
MLGIAMNKAQGTLDFRGTQRRFDDAAATFDNADFVHRKTAAGLMDRLGPIVVDARTVLDLGGGTGSAARDLKRRFKGSRVIVLDASFGMLRQARRKRSPLSRICALQGDAMALPLRTASIDVAFSNLLLPWIDDLHALFLEVARVLKRGGLFIFSTLGPDSLSVLRDAWASVDEGPHVNLFTDMHDVGDALVGAGMADPVLDTDYLNVSYRDTASLFRDLTLAGARNSLSGRARMLTGKGRFQAMLTVLEQQFRDDLLELGLELVYGHAWGSGASQRPGEYLIDASGISHRRV